MTAKPWDLRVGRWQDALADVAMVEAVVVDAPYSERVHAGHDATTALRAVKRLLHADLSPPLFADIPRERPAQLSLDATQPPLDKLQAPV